MRAVLIKSFGNPEDVVHLGEAKIPEAAKGELRIKLLKSPIHNHDLAIIRGSYGYKPELPAVPGSEALGLVDAIGEGVEGFKVGQKVAVPAGYRMWAEYFTTPARTAVPVPPGMSDDIACQLLAMPLNSYLLFEALGTKPGDWIIQTASNGAVGRVVVQLAKSRNVNVISLIRRNDGIDEMKSLGAEHVLSTEDSNWPARVKEMTSWRADQGRNRLRVRPYHLAARQSHCSGRHLPVVRRNVAEAHRSRPWRSHFWRYRCSRFLGRDVGPAGQCCREAARAW